MRFLKLKNVSIPDLTDNNEPYANRPIPKQGGIPLHHLCACIGGTGSGKTTSMLKFLKWYDQAKTFDRLIIFSPTASRDGKCKAFLKEKHFFDITYYPEYTDAIMMEEREKMLADLEEWNTFQRTKKAYEKFLRCKDADELTMEDLELLHACDFRKPEWKYKTEQYPCFALLIDDHVGKKGVFNANCKSKLVEVCVEHRHLSLSIYLLSQVFANFCPKQLRGGVINLWILFSTKSDKHMEDIADAVASKIAPDKFVDAWKFATKDDSHSFLLCDYKHSDINKMLRQNYDKLIVFDGADHTLEDV